jgi:hypothetical protein
MVGAEESLRIEAGVVDLQAVRNRGKPSANNATGINSITLSQKIYKARDLHLGKPLIAPPKPKI